MKTQKEIAHSSRWFRVRVHATEEEKIFDTSPESVEWCREVRETFQDYEMSFDIVEVTEKTRIYK